MRHRFHSICPYFAMFPESFAEHWIAELTKPGDVVLDPFSGRGTTATCALLAGRRAIAADVNDVAWCLSRAKTSAPVEASVLGRLRELRSQYEMRKWNHNADNLPEFFSHCFHRATLKQILYLRANLNWKSRRSDTMLAAIALGSLHGESHRSPSYFSNRMPRTISTKPAYSIRFWEKHGLTAPERDIFDILEQRVRFRYESPRPEGDAKILHFDMRKLPRALASREEPIRCVITSPPYFDVTNFEEDQWLRLWFLGGPPNPTRNRISRDDRHSFEAAYWRFIADMWRSLGAILAANASIVVRLGSSRISPEDLKTKLLATSSFSGRKVVLTHSEVSEIAGRQTDLFRPGTSGCKVEVDCLFKMRGP